MSALEMAKQRRERIRHSMENAALAVMAGDLGAVERLAAEAIGELYDTWPQFAPDEAALGDVLATLALCGGWCAQQRKRVPQGLKALLERATQLRLCWLEAEGAL